MAPLAAELHTEVAYTYAAQNFGDGELRKQLDNIASTGALGWWFAWRQLLPPEHKAKWTEFRAEALRVRLRQALSELDPTLADKVVATVWADNQRHKRERTSAEAMAVPTGGRAERRRGPRSDPGLRQLTLAVIGRMSEEELRALRLPVGLMLDELCGDR